MDCCIGKYGIEPVVEYISGNAKSINTQGFANISIENIGTVDAFLFGFKSPLPVGECECFSVGNLPLAANTPVFWTLNTNPLLAKLKVIKYKIVELCPAQS